MESIEKYEKEIIQEIIELYEKSKLCDESTNRIAYYYKAKGMTEALSKLSNRSLVEVEKELETYIDIRCYSVAPNKEVY